MHPAFRNDWEIDGGHGPTAAARGYSLIEVLLALALTVLIMTAASQLIVSMKRSSDRMRVFAETRQRSQKALDYLALNARGATDMNPVAGNPAAIMVWYQRGGNPVQASWDNVTDPALADAGTDIITIAKAEANIQVDNISWPGFQHASNARWGFSQLCPDGAANLALFKQLTQEHGGVSEPILLVDATGQYGFYQITDYQDAWNTTQGCLQSPPEIHVIANPGNSDLLNPPSGQPTLVDPKMVLGVKFLSFRVRDGWLEQKTGMFDPSVDNPGTSFSPLLPNIEDLQIAWAFRDGTIWDTSAQQLPVAAYPNNVPVQGTGDVHDAINVCALRISVVARSRAKMTWDTKPLFARPAVEDHVAGGSDRFVHHRESTLVMIRNRNLLF